MATMLNVVFDENGYVRSYATAGTLPNGINVAIEEDIDRKDLFDTFSYYKLSNKFISVIVPKEENNEDIIEITENIDIIGKRLNDFLII